MDAIPTFYKEVVQIKERLEKWKPFYEKLAIIESDQHLVDTRRGWIDEIFTNLGAYLGGDIVCAKIVNILDGAILSFKKMTADKNITSDPLNEYLKYFFYTALILTLKLEDQDRTKLIFFKKKAVDSGLKLDLIFSLEAIIMEGLGWRVNNTTIFHLSEILFEKIVKGSERNLLVDIQETFREYMLFCLADLDLLVEFGHYILAITTIRLCFNQYECISSFNSMEQLINQISQKDMSQVLRCENCITNILFSHETENGNENVEENEEDILPIDKETDHVTSNEQLNEVVSVGSVKQDENTNELLECKLSVYTHKRSRDSGFESHSTPFNQNDDLTFKYQCDDLYSTHESIQKAGSMQSACQISTSRYDSENFCDNRISTALEPDDMEIDNSDVECVDMSEADSEENNDCLLEKSCTNDCLKGKDYKEKLSYCSFEVKKNSSLSEAFLCNAILSTQIGKKAIKKRIKFIKPSKSNTSLETFKEDNCASSIKGTCTYTKSMTVGLKKKQKREKKKKQTGNSIKVIDNDNGINNDSEKLAITKSKSCHGQLFNLLY